MHLNNYIEKQLNHRQGKPLIMTHVVCGYPSFDDNWRALEVMAEFGVNLVELQFPFSEPSADGPLFVKANQQAINNGVHVADCFAFMQKVTATFEFKVIMMGYYNTVFKTGNNQFMSQLKNAGGVGFILPDLPIEEAGDLHKTAHQLNLSPIVLMTPTNSDARLKQLAEVANSFIYTVARRGVTGSSTTMNQQLEEFITRCKKFTPLPLAVGFGVNEKQHIEFIGKHADIAIIGTAALIAWEEGREDALRAFFKQLLH